MEKCMSPREIECAEKLMKIVDMEVMARQLLELAISVGNREMETAARETLQRATDQIATLLGTLGRHS